MTQALSPTLSIKLNDKDHEVFMSYGLLNRLTRHLGNIDHLPILAVDPALQETVLVEVFTTRDSKGNATSTPTLHELAISLDDIDKVLDFVGEHIADFFTRAAEKAQARMVRINGRVEAMSASMPTKTGS